MDDLLEAIADAVKAEFTTPEGLVNLLIVVVCAAPLISNFFLRTAAEFAEIVGPLYIHTVDRLFEYLAGRRGTAFRPRSLPRPRPPSTDGWKYVVIAGTVGLFSIVTIQAAKPEREAKPRGPGAPEEQKDDKERRHRDSGRAPQ